MMLVLVRDLTPYTCYRAKVLAKNAVGRSSPGPQSDTFYTEPEGWFVCVCV